MPIFRDRIAAGEELAERLLPVYNPQTALVIALPRGGVMVGAVIAKHLQLPLDVVCPRKITSPLQPEYALGAVTEDGTVFIPPAFRTSLSSVIEEQQNEAKRRALLYRKGGAQPEITGRQVILVDDGIATGLTMLAAVEMIRRQKPAELILAVPVAPPSSLAFFKEKVDSILCPTIDEDFMAVSQYYENFPQITDEEVVRLLELCRNSG